VKIRGDGGRCASTVPLKRAMAQVHLAMDVAATGDIRAVEFTSSQTGDGPMLPDLLAQIGRPAHRHRHGDGTYDTTHVPPSLGEAPQRSFRIRKNGRAKDGPPPGEERTGHAMRPRAFWKRLTGYHAKSHQRGQDALRKSFGDRLMARETRPTPKSTPTLPSQTASQPTRHGRDRARRLNRRERENSASGLCNNAVRHTPLRLGPLDGRKASRSRPSTSASLSGKTKR